MYCLFKKKKGGISNIKKLMKIQRLKIAFFFWRKKKKRNGCNIMNIFFKINKEMSDAKNLIAKIIYLLN